MAQGWRAVHDAALAAGGPSAAVLSRWSPSPLPLSVTPPLSPLPPPPWMAAPSGTRALAGYALHRWVALLAPAAMNPPPGSGPGPDPAADRPPAEGWARSQSPDMLAAFGGGGTQGRWAGSGRGGGGHCVVPYTICWKALCPSVGCFLRLVWRVRYFTDFSKTLLSCCSFDAFRMPRMVGTPGNYEASDENFDCLNFSPEVYRFCMQITNHMTEGEKAEEIVAHRNQQIHNIQALHLTHKPYVRDGEGDPTFPVSIPSPERAAASQPSPPRPPSTDVGTAAESQGQHRYGLCPGSEPPSSYGTQVGG